MGRDSAALRSHQVTNCQVPLATYSVSLQAPHTIISDNRTNFASKQVASFCAKYKITHRFSTPYYPQGNGQAESSNRTILDSLCKSLDKTKANGWRNSPEYSGPIGPPSAFPLAKPMFASIWTETIIPVDLSMLSFRVEEVDQDQNNARWISQKKSDSRRNRTTPYQRQTQTAHHKKVKVREFYVGDLVLKRVIQTTQQKDQGS